MEREPASQVDRGSAPQGSLFAHLPAEPTDGSDALLDAFLDFVSERGLELYPAQEEAILELLSDRHVVLDTPTGSGKSLVAVALLFRALASGRGRAFYTCPIKALVSEKFFELCELFGAERVGMLTGDASINHDAPIICCTAEILSNLALREGDASEVAFAVMDEFHFYADPERGVAWQVPLLALEDTQFLLMSATLGDMGAVQESLERLTTRKVSVVRSDMRPVPLDYEYRELPLTQTIANLCEAGKAPIYVVSFTHRDCAELAQALTSLNLMGREQRKEITESLAGFRFDSPFGKDLRRCLGHGIGLHHAGLLPKYRRLVERLAQQGKLAVICGTDTLGVGINVPIRTVLFTKLCKFDGEQTRRLSVRELKQIAGRAGRRGYDHQGSVVCQAPEHVIENKLLEGKAGGDVKKKRKLTYKKPPERGYVHWDEAVFEKLRTSPPEPLVSRFRVDHGMLLELLERPSEVAPRGYRALVRLIAECHERDVIKARLRLRSKELFKSLRAAEVVQVRPTPSGRSSEALVSEHLQLDFSLHHSLSLYLVEALDVLDPQVPTYALDVLSFVEAILENPNVVLEAQAREAREALFQKLKAEGVEYEQRMAELDKVSYPKPNAELIYDSFNAYASHHPWLGTENIRPKSIARDLVERYLSFNDYVKEYGLARAEGVLLRYLSEAYKTVVQSVPDPCWNDELVDIMGFLRATLERVDSSLLEEWEKMLAPDTETELGAARRVHALANDPRMLASRVRSELHMLVKALAAGDWEEGAACLRLDVPEPWTGERLEHALEPFFAQHDRLIADARARQTQWTILEPLEPRLYRVRQVLLDPAEDNDFYLEARVDLRQGEPEGPLLELLEVSR
ncbi:MAG: DEAD/DEAH box helicase [Polyangiales bacterium]